MRPTKLIIVLIMVGLFAGVMSLFMTQIAINYDVPGEGNATITRFETLDNLTKTAQRLQDSEQNTTVRTGIFDVLGEYFKGGYTALRITKESVGVGEALAGEALDGANLGQAGILFKQAITAILIILVFLGVIVAALIQRDT